MRLKGKKYWVALLRAKENGAVIPFTLMRPAPPQGDYRPAEVRVYTSRSLLIRALKNMPRECLEACAGQLGVEIPPATWMYHLHCLVQDEVARYGVEFRPEHVLCWPVAINGRVRVDRRFGPVQMLEIFRELEVRGVELGAVIPEAQLFPKVQTGGEA